jgi:hypothetical protein
MVGAPFIRLGQNIQLVAGMISLCQRLLLYRNGGANRVEALQQMTPALPLGHEPFGPELKAEGLEAEWHFRVIYERNVMPVPALMAELLTHPLIHKPMPEKTGSTQYVQLNRTESCKTRIYPPAQDR